VIHDTAANIAAFTDAGNAFAGGVIAITTDTGKVLFDSDGNFSNGYIELATFTSSQGPFIGGANLTFIA
jgi:hypothetical protein